MAYKMRDWKKDAPIVECHEPLMRVPDKIVYPYYHRQMNIGRPEMYLRQSVLEKLLLAAEELKNKGYQLMAYDGWRPVEVQEQLYFQYMKIFAIPKFGLQGYFAHCQSAQSIKEILHSSVISIDTREALWLAMKSYVSWPCKGPNAPSPHTTGGSVDVWLHDITSGDPLNMGVSFDWMEENSGAFYHLKRQHKKFVDDETVCQRRTDLILAMVHAGFSCYGPEFWHFNFGNQMDAIVTRETARYGYIEPPVT